MGSPGREAGLSATQCPSQLPYHFQGGMGRQGGLVTSLKNILWIR